MQNSSRSRLLRQAGTSRRNGFTLLITIVLISFLVLLMVSIAALTRVEVQIATNYQQLDKARSNALLALNIALGQLQQTAGPDQRVTTTAQAFATNLTGVATTATNGAKLWTGVWGNNQSSSVEPSYTDPASTTSTPQLLNWLVSGNEKVTFTASTAADNFGQITTAATGLAFAPDVTISPSPAITQDALTSYTIGSVPGVLLAGPNSCGKTSGAESGYVVAPLVDIKAGGNLIPGLGGATQIPIGRYAYWVGDEGVKARINLQDPYNPACATISPTEAQLRARVQVAQRVATELIDDDSNFTNGTLLKTYFPANSLAVSKILDSNQLALIGADTAKKAVLGTTRKLRFHDLTTYSHGVLTDTLRGGLRQDLTAAFKTGTTAVDAPTGPIWQLTKHPVNPTWNPDPTQGFDGKGPTWQLLRSYYQLADSVTGTGASATIAQRAHRVDIPGDTTQHGVSPVVALFQMYTEAKLVPEGSGNFHLELRHIPAVVLWNPYNITLNNAQYYGQIDFSDDSVVRPSIFYARVMKGLLPSFAANAISSAANIASPYFYNNTANSAVPKYAITYPITGTSGNWGPYTPNVVSSRNRACDFYLNTGVMSPGSAYVYALDADFPTTVIDPATPTLTRGWGVGASNGYGIVVKSPSFSLPALPVAADPGDQEKYFFVFYSSRSNSMPAHNEKAPDVDDYIAGLGLTLREFTSTSPTNKALGNLVQNIRSVQDPTFKAGKTTPKENAYKNLGSAPVSTEVASHFPIKIVLRTTLNSYNYRTPGKIRWAEGYNPRAVISSGETPFVYSYKNPYGTIGVEPAADTVNAVPSSSYSIVADTPAEGGKAYFGYDFTVNSQGAIFYDVPRPETRILSLGALQHVNAYREVRKEQNSRFSPANPIGNSRADLQVGYGAVAYQCPAPRLGFGFYDHSYLFNRALWDGYFFSGVPATGAIPSILPNSRLIQTSTNLDPADLRTTAHAGAGLLTTGAFNINSTSVEAWRAILGSTLNVPVGATARSDEAPFSRTLYPPDETSVMTAASSADSAPNSFKGYRFLTSDQLDSLATAIVTEVKNRGPFVCLADFVNRALVDNPATTFDERTMGALANALDATQQALPAKRPNGAFSSNSTDFEVFSTTSLPLPGRSLATPISVNRLSQGVPGWVTQADVLQTLGPVLSARSDTFVIRTYGDVLDAVNSTKANPQVQSRAWCEAVVQRLPDYVDNTSAGQEAWQRPTAVNSINQTFGRRFKIISFKWLSPFDI